MAGPLEQFRVVPYIDIILGEESYMNISLTNSTLMMIVTVVALVIFFLISTKQKKISPSKLQLFAELCYGFVLDMFEGTVGSKGRVFFPFIFCLFMFIAFANVVGMVPYSFTVTSQLIVTFAIALFVFFMVMFASIYKNGTGFFRHFCPQGTPLFVLPLLTIIEVFAYLVRPISLCLRMSANMIAGHVLLKVIAQLTGGMGLFFFLPLAFIVIMTGFEIFVALLQAYIFTILTCVYLNDALEMH